MPAPNQFPSAVPDAPVAVLKSTTVVGIRHDASSSTHQVAQFRGIKYASVPSRFAHSQLFDSYPPTLDASKHGPICPQVLTPSIDHTLYGLSPTQIPITTFSQDEFECLNLSITVPVAALSPKASATRHTKLLPVLVWIHGGGYSKGSGSRWILDPGRLVRHSAELGKPIVVVSINYRLGMFGFAASGLLSTSTSPTGEKASGSGNYGLCDQLNALKWVQKHISAFGGNPNHVTVGGEGKGASSTHALLLHGAGRPSKAYGKPLIHQAILQSGVCPPVLPKLWQQDIEFRRVLANLKLSSDAAGIEALRKLPAAKLVEASASVKISPTDDGVFFPRGTLPLSGPPALGIDAILMGDTHNESSPYVRPAAMWTSNSLNKRVRALLRSPYKSDALLRAFEVDEDSEAREGRDEMAERVGELIGDCLVAYGVEKLANGLYKEDRTRVYRFTFDQPSPVKLTSGAHHAVDLVYLFGNIDFKTLHTPAGAKQVIPAGSSCNTGPNTDDGVDDFDDGGNSGGNASDSDYDSFGYWGSTPGEDEARVSDIMQEKWIEFIRGEEVWGEYVPYAGTSSTWGSGSVTPSSASSGFRSRSASASASSDTHAHAAALMRGLSFTPMMSPDSPVPTRDRDREGEIFIFGPTGDAAAAPVSELGWRRRVDKWREAFGFDEGGSPEAAGDKDGPETIELEDVIKVGMELANGPVTWGR